jgi:hypothetical protein
MKQAKNDVAMLLIDEQDNLPINEAARSVLQDLWEDAYWENMKLLIPTIAEQLNAGYLSASEVKMIDEDRPEAGLDNLQLGRLDAFRGVR